MWHGMFLFLVGLVIGLLEARFTNIRMGLAAHLEGVMNGIFLIALGAIWMQLRLAPRLEPATFWAALYGTYFNCALTTFAAVVGTGALSPITAAGRAALTWRENLVTVGFMTVGLAIIATSVLVLWGLRRKVGP